MIGIRFFVSILGVCLHLPITDSFLSQPSLQRGLTRRPLSNNLFITKWNDARMILTTTKPSSFVTMLVDQYEAVRRYTGKSHVVSAISLLVLGLLVKTMLQMISRSSMSTTGKQFTSRNTNDESRSPYGRSETYNAALATEYFNKRPLMVMARGLTIITTSVYFLFLLWKDKWMGKLLRWSKQKQAKLEAKRADQLADLLTRIGRATTSSKISYEHTFQTILLTHLINPSCQPTQSTYPINLPYQPTPHHWLIDPHLSHTYRSCLRQNWPIAIDSHRPTPASVHQRIDQTAGENNLPTVTLSTLLRMHTPSHTLIQYYYASYTLSMHPLIHPFNSPYQPILSTHHLNRPLNPPHQPNNHPIALPLPTSGQSVCVSHPYRPSDRGTGARATVSG